MDDTEEIVWMVRGAWVSLSLRATCELGIVDALDEPATLATLATRTASDPATLARLLRVLVDLGLLEVEPGLYAATPRGETLRVDHPSGVRNLALMQTTIPNLTTWQHLADAVRQGGPVYEDLHGQTSWDWLAAHPEQGAVFNAAMARRSALQLAALRAATDLSAARLLVDVGGGQGGMVAALLAEQPSLHALVADRPEVAAEATAALAAGGLADRARGEPADFFVAVPPGVTSTSSPTCCTTGTTPRPRSSCEPSGRRWHPRPGCSSSRTCSMRPDERSPSSATSTSSTCTCWSCSGLGSERRRSTTHCWSPPASSPPR